MKIRFNILELLGFIGYWIFVIFYIYLLFNINDITKNENDPTGAKVGMIMLSSIFLVAFTLPYHFTTNHFSFLLKLLTKDFTINLPQ